MRGILALAAVALVGLVLVPAGEAHVCQTTTENVACACPTQDDGYAHDHKTPSAHCAQSSRSGPFGAPGPGTLFAIVALGAVALLARRR